MERLGALLGPHGLLAGQVLLTPHDFGVRSQYLHARETLRRLLDLGVVPVVNENDTVADDEIRYGDNDRLAALGVAPRRGRRARPPHRHRRACSPPTRALDADASLIEEIVEVDAALEALAGGTGTERGSGGHGDQARGGEDRRVVGGAGGHRRRRRPRRGDRRHRRSGGRHESSCPGPNGSRAGSCGSPSPGLPPGASSSTTAPAALCVRTTALCCRPACPGVEGAFDADDAVEIVDGSGVPFAKGLVRYPAACSAGSPGADLGARPRACRTRSSTATTSWSPCP